MRGKLLLLAAGSVVCAALLLAQGGGGAGKSKAKGPAACDRACLEDFVNQYLDALVAHNPFGLPLAARVKFSENDQLLDLGDGLWSVTTGLGTYKLYISDVQGQQVAFLGTVRANDRPTTLALRLKIENRRISEIETLVTVSNAGGPPAAGPGAARGAAATRPFSVDVAELFRIKDRQIRKVEALMVSLPYGQQNPFVPKR